MSVKHIIVPDIGKVAVHKRKGVRSLKLSIAHDGSIRLTMPTWTPIKAGVIFLNNHKAWIKEHNSSNEDVLINGSRIGKAHYVVFTNSTSNKTAIRLVGNEIRVGLPENMTYSSPEGQKAARKGSIRALKKEADQLLPERLSYLANKYEFEYKSVQAKQLKSRWGSCSSNKDISLSIFLMQLPWELIDYVILHELTHTKILAHGPKFWDEMNKILPDSKKYRKEVNKYKPIVTPIK